MSQSFWRARRERGGRAALAARGIAEPFRIQSLVVPVALEGRDVLGKAPTGSGKTLAFALPIVELVSADEPAPAALVLAPTRELALQVTEELSCSASRRASVRRPPTAAPRSGRR
jgi:Superfamily II DNA and RNA helicases